MITKGKCKMCNKNIWFWEKDIRRLSEPDEIGDRFGMHFHKKCEDNNNE